MRENQLPIRIYYEDTDAGGVTYHASYIRFCERGRTEFLRDAGFENSAIKDKFDMLFIVRSLTADYLAPTYLDDLLTLKTTVKTMKNTSFVMRQLLEKDEKVIFELEVVIVCIDANKKPVRIPDGIRQSFEKEN